MNLQIAAQPPTAPTVLKWLQTLIPRGPGLHVLGYAYSSPAEFVLVHGETFEWAPLPAGIKAQKLGHCWWNARDLVAASPHLEYVEGWAHASGPNPVAHGWAIDRVTRRVVDPTWPDLGIDDNERLALREYHGVVLPRSVWANWTGGGIIDSFDHGWPLLHRPFAAD